MKRSKTKKMRGTGNWRSKMISIGQLSYCLVVVLSLVYLVLSLSGLSPDTTSKSKTYTKKLKTFRQSERRLSGSKKVCTVKNKKSEGEM